MSCQLLGRCEFSLPPPLWGRVGVGGAGSKKLPRLKSPRLDDPHPGPGVVKSWSCAAKAFIAFLLMGTLVF